MTPRRPAARSFAALPFLPVLCLMAVLAAGPAPAAARVADASPPVLPVPDAATVSVPAQASAAARYAIRRGFETGDAVGHPFAVVDKRHARIYVYDAGGRLAGQSAVLTGQAVGDTSVPGIGQRPVAQIRPEERTTPAGRFRSVPGRNLAGDANVWIDYGTSIAIHRVRPGRSYAARLRSLASPDPARHRLSYGCVVVPPAFFDGVIRPTLGRGPGVVYVLPDDSPVQALFQAPGRPGATHVAAR